MTPPLTKRGQKNYSTIRAEIKKLERKAHGLRQKGEPTAQIENQLAELQHRLSLSDQLLEPLGKFSPDEDTTELGYLPPD